MGWIKQPLHLKITFKLKPKKKLNTHVHTCKDTQMTLLSHFYDPSALRETKTSKKELKALALVVLFVSEERHTKI